MKKITIDESELKDLKQQLKFALKKLREKKSITIYFSDEDLEDLQCGETFDWTFDGVDVHLTKGEEE